MSLIASSAARRVSTGALRAIVVGGTAAGIIDAVVAVVAYVIVLRAMSLVGVLQYIATGLLGPAAFSGGLATAGLGVVIHFFLAYTFGAIYWLASRKIPALVTHVVPAGLVYGVGIWLVMNLLVLPLTGVPKSDVNLALDLSFIVGHAVGVGLPIALAVRRFAR